MTELSPEIEWTDKLERYFADTGEKAHALGWLHKKAQERYSMLRNYTDLPIVVLGVLNGSISIGSSSLFGDSPYASVGVGIIALITAILGTIGSYFKWAARAEAHRISAIQYDKLYRFLCIQCSLPRDERMSPAELLKYTKDAYDRLIEIAPMIPPEAIREFQRRFDSNPKYNKIARPAECNGLESIEIFEEKRDDAQISSPPVSGPPARQPSILRRISSSYAIATSGAAGSVQSRNGGLEVKPEKHTSSEGLQQESRPAQVST